MDRQFTIADAFSLEPLALEGVKPFELGDRVYLVPPLTLGRFLKLMSFNVVQAIAEMLGQTVPKSEDGETPSVSLGQCLLLMEKSPEVGLLVSTLVASLRAVMAGQGEPGALSEVAAVMIPGLDRAAWREHATAWHVGTLYALMAKGHDWGFIAESAGLWNQADDLEDRVPLEQGLVAFSAVYGAYKLEDFFETRVEGFYRNIQAAAEHREAQNEDESDQVPSDAMPTVRDPDRYQHLHDLMFASEQKAREVQTPPPPEVPRGE